MSYSLHHWHIIGINSSSSSFFLSSKQERKMKRKSDYLCVLVFYLSNTWGGGGFKIWQFNRGVFFNCNTRTCWAFVANSWLHVWKWSQSLLCNPGNWDSLDKFRLHLSNLFRSSCSIWWATRTSITSSQQGLKSFHFISILFHFIFILFSFISIFFQWWAGNLFIYK